MRKIWILLALIMILITAYQINTTYAKYFTEAQGIVEETIGPWIVKINGTNIATEADVQTFTINDLNYNSNDYVLDGKIAPGLLGYFDIVIDATGASVAVRYDVTIDFDQLNISDSIKFAKLVRVVNGVEDETGIIQTDVNTYTGTISLADVEAGTTNTIRVYLEWEDDGTGANDAEDSILGTTKDIQVAIPIEVKASQYLGEKLIEYI